MDQGELPRRVVLDTNILWSAVLSPGSNAAMLPCLRDRLTFYLVHEVRREFENQTRELEASPIRQAGISALLDRFLRSAGAIELPASVATGGLSGDVAIATSAELLRAAVCTYNVDDFKDPTTPVSLLRAANLWQNYAELPSRQDEGTILYLIRVHGRRSVGKLIQFADGTLITGVPNRRIEVRQVGRGTGETVRSRHSLPESEYHGLVIRFDSHGRLRVDAWHPTGRRATLGGEATGQSGNLTLIDTTISTDKVWLSRFGHPSNCEGFGVSTAPRWLKDSSISSGLRVETLEGSWASEAKGELLKRLRVVDFGSFWVAEVDGQDKSTKFLPGGRWTPWVGDEIAALR